MKRIPRVRIAQIVMDYLAYGWSVEEMCRQHPYLTLAEAHGAMSYYFDNQEEIDLEIRTEWEEAKISKNTNRYMDIDKAIQELQNEKNIRFTRLMKITENFFGEPRNRGSSHYPFKVPWEGEPRINLQQGKQGKAKPYQVKQVRLALIKRKEILEGKNDD